MRKYGSLFFGEHLFDVYAEETFDKFYEDEEKKTELNKEDIRSWTEWLTSTWPDKLESYTIEVMQDSIYDDPLYIAYYNMIGYYELSSTIYGYGKTPQDALQDCINHMEYLKKIYSK